MKWSKYQKAIFQNVHDQKTGHVIVEAVAGSGKTSTLLESLNHIPDEKTWLLVAFTVTVKTKLT